MFTWARRALAHTRFVPTRVYRLMVVAWLISGVLQLLYGAPESIQSTSGPAGWFDWAFVVAQLLSSIFILTGLYLVQEHTKDYVFVDEREAKKYNERLTLSLTIELMGVIGIQTVIAVQVAASAFYQGRVPSAGVTWMAIMFAVFLSFRARDIVKSQRMLA